MVLALLGVGGLSVGSAFGDPQGNQGHNGGEGRHGGYRNQHDNHGHRGYRRDEHHHDYPYMYAQPVYVPPPVYYPPMPTPGINLFFPIELR